MADCRLCVFFKRPHQLTREQRERASRAAALRRSTALGWCARRGGVVTYYVGKCRFYREKPQGSTRPLRDFFKV